MTRTLLERLHDEIARICEVSGAGYPPVITRETRLLLEECAAEIEAAEGVRKELSRGLAALAMTLAKPIKHEPTVTCTHGTPSFLPCPECRQ